MPRVNPPTTRTISGRRTVTYVDAKRNGRDAVVTGGTGSSLNLFVPTMPKAQQRKTGIAKQTARTQTNVWR